MRSPISLTGSGPRFHTITWMLPLGHLVPAHWTLATQPDWCHCQQCPISYFAVWTQGICKFPCTPLLPTPLGCCLPLVIWLLLYSSSGSPRFTPWPVLHCCTGHGTPPPPSPSHIYFPNSQQIGALKLLRFYYWTMIMTTECVFPCSLTATI